MKKGTLNFWNPPNPDNVWKFIEFGDSCWNWIGAISPEGYGRFGFNCKTFMAHRFVYEYLMGKELPEGLVSDHLCRNRKCVNPEHLQFLTITENTRIGNHTYWNTNKTHCVHGHELTKENTYIRKNGSRQCKECTMIRLLVMVK